MRRFAASFDALNNAASPHAGLNRTDMRALDILNLRRRLTAGQLAASLRLTTGAITAVIDRLERAGHVARRQDADDGRLVVVEPTPAARRQGYLIFKGVTDDIEAIFDSCSDSDREVIAGFMQRVTRALSDRAEELSAR